MKTSSAAKLVAIVVLATIIGCMPRSSEIVVRQVTSSEYTATLSKRNSGAMSKGSTLVSVRLTSVPDNDTHGLIVLDVTGDKPVEMKWIGPHSLALSCASCVPQDVNDETVKAGQIAITYSDNLRVDGPK